MALETLAGRLKWESTADGIRVVIPARLNWESFRRSLVQACVLGSIFVAIDYCCARWPHTTTTAPSGYWWHDLLCVGIGVVIGGMIPRLFGRTLVTVSPSNLTIQWKSRIWRSKKEVYSTGDVHSLRFVEKPGKHTIQNELGQSEIQFREDYRPLYFGTGVTSDEAQALIALMMKVYPFRGVTATESARVS